MAAPGAPGVPTQVHVLVTGWCLAMALRDTRAGQDRRTCGTCVPDRGAQRGDQLSTPRPNAYNRRRERHALRCGQEQARRTELVGGRRLRVCETIDSFGSIIALDNAAAVDSPKAAV
eukprot:634375-Rhodomonas_salina.1